MTDSTFQPSSALTNAAAWQIAAGLARQHPERLRIIELHPGGGHYDCLTVLEHGRAYDEAGSLQLNRRGRAHVWRRFDGQPLPENGAPDSFSVWPEFLTSNEPVEAIRRIAHRAGLPVPGSLPPSTRRSLAYRVIAEFVVNSVFHSGPWDVRNGFLDSSGAMGSRVMTEWFDQLPPAAAALREAFDDPLGSPAYQFWFMQRAGEVLACVHENGWAWRSNGRGVDLFAEFERGGHRVWPALHALVGDSLR